MTKHAPLKSIFSIALFFGITSCDDESKVQTSVSTQFIQNRLSMTENSATSEVSIILSRPALQDGIITISAAAEDLNRFNTNPEIIGGQIELHIATGQREVAFSF